MRSFLFGTQVAVDFTEKIEEQSVDFLLNQLFLILKNTQIAINAALPAEQLVVLLLAISFGRELRFTF